MRTLLLVAACLFLALPVQVAAADRWIRLTTPNFEMYTTNSEKQAEAALQVFEQIRYFFKQSSKSKSAPSTRVRIIAFRSEKEYKPYRPNEGTFAYYTQGRKADYIVMQDISPEHYQAIMHEYTHLIVAHDKLKFPVWLNEGLADLYSSLEPKGNQAMVGRPLEGRAYVLQNERWLDLNTLFAVGPESPYYNEGNKMSIFYAESWALTHMLALSKNYTAAYPVFLSQMNSGHPAADCLQSVYGKSVAQVTQDVHAYMNQSSFRAAVFDLKIAKADLETDMSEPSDLSVELSLADLLANMPATFAQAQDRLSELAKTHPESAEVQESLGYLAWSQNNHDKVREHFKLAMDRGSTNAEMLFQYAQFLQEATAPSDGIEAVLRRVVFLQPDYKLAWLNLGMTDTQMARYGAAIDSFSHIKSVKPEEAYGFFSAQAFCYLQLKAYPQSREAGEKAKQYAAGLDQIQNASNLLKHLDQLEKPEVTSQVIPPVASNASSEISDVPERPTLRHKPEVPRDQPTVYGVQNLQHVEAISKWFDCDSKKRRLHVLAAGKEMILEIEDPQMLIVRNTKGGYVDFQCGAQKPVNVGVFYVPASPSSKVDGTIRELVY